MIKDTRKAAEATVQRRGGKALGARQNGGSFLLERGRPSNQGGGGQPAEGGKTDAAAQSGAKIDMRRARRRPPMLAKRSTWRNRIFRIEQYERRLQPNQT